MPREWRYGRIEQSACGSRSFLRQRGARRPHAVPGKRTGLASLSCHEKRTRTADYFPQPASFRMQDSRQRHPQMPNTPPLVGFFAMLWLWVSVVIWNVCLRSMPAV